MSQDIKPSLLHSVDKMHDGALVTRVLDQQDDVRPPVLDVVFAQVQFQQVLPDLVKQQVLHD